jgi:hypothetical protein
MQPADHGTACGPQLTSQTLTSAGGARLSRGKDGKPHSVRGGRPTFGMASVPRPAAAGRGRIRRESGLGAYEGASGHLDAQASMLVAGPIQGASNLRSIRPSRAPHPRSRQPVRVRCEAASMSEEALRFKTTVQGLPTLSLSAILTSPAAAAPKNGQAVILCHGYACHKVRARASRGGGGHSREPAAGAGSAAAKLRGQCGAATSACLLRLTPAGRLLLPRSQRTGKRTGSSRLSFVEV